MSTTVLVILAGAVLTYLTRVGGDLVLSRFDKIHPRVEAGLNAVPAAVLTTLVAPAVMTGGPVELTALAVAGLVALRGGMMAVFLSGRGRPDLRPLFLRIATPLQASFAVAFSSQPRTSPSTIGAISSITRAW